MYFLLRPWFLAVLLALLFTSASAAGDGGIQVNDRTIPEEEINMLLAGRPLSGDENAVVRGQRIREQLIARELFAQEARKAKLEKTPAFTTKARMAREELLAREYQAQYVAEHQPSEAELKSAYASLKQRAGGTAYHLRQIFVLTESEATTIVSRLNAGEKFDALAASASKDEMSRQKGGDLGWLTVPQMLPQVVESVTALKKGEFTGTAVKEPGGWHIILLEDTRPYALAPLEQLMPQLQRELSRQKLIAHLSELRKKAKIR